MEESPKAIFLSYAREDTEAARRIADALRGFGVEVWFDIHELRGGDVWEAKIRKHIRECALFVPIISAHTQARPEGFFRREWHLAIDRLRDMSASRSFIAPVVIDAVAADEADVPEEFLRYQWMPLTGGAPTPEFVAQIKRLLEAPARSKARSGGHTLPATRSPIEDTRHGLSRRTIWIGALALAGAVALAAVALLRERRPTPAAAPPVKTVAAATAATPPMSADEKAVAVLPFANLSGDQEQDYFSDGLTEEILNALARESDLRVPGRASAFSFKGKAVPMAEIARALNVSRLVEGSVRRAGNRVRINVQLTRAADGFSEALPVFERELTDIFALQEEVARAVVAKLTRRTGTTTPVAVLTKNPAAYDAYLRGRDYAAQTSPSWPKAIEAFDRAVQLDPQFALAWANLGRLLAFRIARFDADALMRAPQVIDEALRLQPDLPEAHLARASYLRAIRGSFDEMMAALERAERARPNDPDVLRMRAEIEGARGHEETAFQLTRRTVELDPRNGASLNYLALALMTRGQYAEADHVLQQAFAILQSSIPLTNRAALRYYATGDRAEVVRLLEDAPAEMRTVNYWYIRAMLLYHLGDYDGALASAARVTAAGTMYEHPDYIGPRALEAKGDLAGARAAILAVLPTVEKGTAAFPMIPNRHAVLARLYAGLGRKEEALAAARKAVEVSRPDLFPNDVAGWFGPTPHVVLAQVLARFGMIDEALALVEKHVTARQWPRNFLLVNPDWAVLQKDARFQALAAQARL